MGRIRDYIKYSRGELENYTKIPDSCVKRINTTSHLEFPPFGLKNFKESLMHIISQRKIGFYDEDLKGIILDIRNIKILSNLAAIRFDSPGLHINMRADFYIFQPHVGAKIKGIVKHVSQRQIGVIVYRVFSVKIRLQEDVQNNIELNSEVEFRIKDFDLQNVIPFIEGELTNEPVMVNSGPPPDDDMVGDPPETATVEESTVNDLNNEDISEWPKSSSFVTSTQVSQKSPQKTIIEKQKHRGSKMDVDTEDSRNSNRHSIPMRMKTEEGSSDDEDENLLEHPQHKDTPEQPQLMEVDENSDSSEDKSSGDTTEVSTSNSRKAKTMNEVPTTKEEKSSDDESDQNDGEITVGRTKISQADYPHIPQEDPIPSTVAVPFNGHPEEVNRIVSPNIFAAAEETDSDESISQVSPSQAPQKSLTKIRGSGKSSKIFESASESQENSKADNSKQLNGKSEHQKVSSKASKNVSDETIEEKVIFSAEIVVPLEEQSQEIEKENCSNPLLDFIESVKAEKSPVKPLEKSPKIKEECDANTSGSKRKRERKLSKMDQSLLDIFNKIKREKRASESDRSDNDSSIFVKPEPRALPSPAGKVRKKKDKANNSVENSLGSHSSFELEDTVIFVKPSDVSNWDGDNIKSKKKNKKTTENCVPLQFSTTESETDTDTGSRKKKKKKAHSSDSVPEIVVKEEVFTSDTDTGIKKKKKKRNQASDSALKDVIKEENLLNGLQLRVTSESDASQDSYGKQQNKKAVTNATEHVKTESSSKKRESFSLVKEEPELADDVSVKKERISVEIAKRRLNLDEVNSASSTQGSRPTTETQEETILAGRNLKKKRKRKHEDDTNSEVSHDVSSTEAPSKSKKKKKSSEISLKDSLLNILRQAKTNKLNKTREKEGLQSTSCDMSLANESAFSSPGLSSTRVDGKPSI